MLYLIVKYPNNKFIFYNIDECGFNKNVYNNDLKIITKENLKIYNKEATNYITMSYLYDTKKEVIWELYGIYVKEIKDNNIYKEYTITYQQIKGYTKLIFNENENIRLILNKLRLNKLKNILEC